MLNLGKRIILKVNNLFYKEQRKNEKIVENNK
ncbi:hypothetical protein CHY_1749 [Carboxydothermus hydrogenoformans Z-2901]|uniref:Uncharacterized protein n=1 Tax=Carboxydothermus hydrogenoformans (strain ATCC BAA-161 / DSM 6008 / Z-2901) TaxID=246194 RepID=Q3ABB5_CARHZ|nr:hypothetical protein CHY_1749 [Carboxydothermus hydrogenoformans Z-2901]